MKPFLDANVLVKAFFDNNEQDSCKKVLCEEFITNMVCLAEAQEALATILKNQEQAASWMKSVFKANGVIVDVDKNTLFESFKYLDHLTIWDAIHYATALLNNCSEIVSYDKDFDGLKIKRMEP
ncbi:MAG: PIN domain-containing protein [Nanoarchaeota archaeon]